MAGVAAALMIFFGGDLFFGNHNILSPLSVELTTSAINKEVPIKEAVPVAADPILADNGEDVNILQANPKADAKAAGNDVSFIRTSSKAIKANAKQLARRVNQVIKKNKEENTSFASNTVTFRDTGF